MQGDFVAVAGLVPIGLLVSVIAGLTAGVLRPVVVAYVGHCAVSIFLYDRRGLFSPDAEHYDAIGQFVAFGYHMPGNYMEIAPGKEGFPWILGQAYELLGHVPQFGLLLNATLCALLVALVGSTAARGDLPVRLAAWLAVLYPMLWIWGSLLLREPAVWVLVMLFAHGAVGIAAGRGRLAVNVAECVAAVLLLVPFRGTAAVLVVVGGAGSLAIRWFFGRDARTRRWLFGLVLASVLLVVGGWYVVGAPGLATLNIIRTALSEDAASTGFPATPVTGPASAIVASAQVVPRVVVGPLPSEWLRMSPIFVVDGVLWTCTLVLAGIGSWLRRRTYMTWLPSVLVVGALLGALIVTSGNYGTMVRLRLVALPVLLPLAALGAQALWYAWFRRWRVFHDFGTPEPGREIDAVRREDVREFVGRIRASGSAAVGRSGSRTPVVDASERARRRSSHVDG